MGGSRQLVHGRDLREAPRLTTHVAPSTPRTQTVTVCGPAASPEKSAVSWIGASPKAMPSSSESTASPPPPGSTAVLVLPVSFVLSMRSWNVQLGIPPLLRIQAGACRVTRTRVPP
jgi:hypothetical protein